MRSWVDPTWTGPAAVLVAVLVAAVTGCAGPEPAAGPVERGRPLFSEIPGSRETVAFTGTVRAVDFLHTERERKESGGWKVRIYGPPGLPMIVVDSFTSAFAATVRVDSVAEENERVAAGEDTVFAIHSPVQLFLVPGEEAVGRRYRFELSYRDLLLRDGSKMRSCRLSATPAEE